MELFKEKEEQEIIKKDFDPESGIEIPDRIDLDKIKTLGVSKNISKNSSEFIKLDHGVIYEEASEFLDLEEVITKELQEAESISIEFQEVLEKIEHDQID